MYLFKVKSLTEDFKAGNVTQKEKFGYLVLILVFRIIFEILDSALPPLQHSITYYHFFSAVIEIIVTIIGLYFCYKSNVDNEEFIDRVMCLFVPVSIRLFLLMIIVQIATNSVFAKGTLELDLFLMLLDNAFGVIRYIWIHSCIVEISSSRKLNKIESD